MTITMSPPSSDETSRLTSTRLRMVPLPNAPDEEVIELQAALRRADTPVRYARAEYSAACQAVDLRMEEANKARAALYDLVQSDVQGTELWNARFASQMAANRVQISAGVVITTRTKLEMLESHRHAAQQTLDDYVRNPYPYRLARAADERKRAAEEKMRTATEKAMSQASRVAKIREAAQRGSEKTVPTGTKPFHGSHLRPQQEEREKLEQRKQSSQHAGGHDSTKSFKPKDRTNEHIRPAVSRPLPPLPPLPPPLQVTDTERYQSWHESTKVAFADYSSLTTFPVPPTPEVRCRKLDCFDSQAKRELGICHDDIERAFTELGLATLKEERLRWHPDRFVRCQEQEKMQRLAKIVFQIVDGLYRRGRNGQRA